jgi:hypothetical protein
MRQEEINEVKAPTASVFEVEFLAAGTKASLQGWWDAAEAERAQHLKAAEDIQAAMDVRRHPRTIKGFLTKEQAWEAIQSATRDDMIVHGLTVKSDRKAFFLTDDIQLGFRVLPKKFIGCTFSLPLGTAHQVFSNIDDFIKHFCHDELYLSSIDELEAYLQREYGMYFDE